MIALLAIWSTFWAFAGLMTWMLSQSAIHEGVSALCFLVATVAAGQAGVIAAIKEAKK